MPSFCELSQNLNAAICCLEYVQTDLAGLGLDNAVTHIASAIGEISNALVDAEPESANKIILLDQHRR